MEDFDTKTLEVGLLTSKEEIMTESFFKYNNKFGKRLNLFSLAKKLQKSEQEADKREAYAVF